MPKEVIYSDVNLDAGEDPHEIVTNEDALNQNIAAILDTPIGSKWFRPEIGSQIDSFLFDPIDEVTADRIKFEMETALERNGENRIVFDRVDVIPDPQNSQYYVNIEYSSPALDTGKGNFTFNLAQGYQ